MKNKYWVALLNNGGKLNIKAHMEDMDALVRDKRILAYDYLRSFSIKRAVLDRHIDPKDGEIL